MSDITENEETTKEIITPDNYDPNQSHTLYTFGSNRIRVSNSWSRKSINLLTADGGLLWALNNKCNYCIRDEFGTEYNSMDDGEFKQFDSETIELIDISTHNWISKVIVGHVDFLVESLRKQSMQK